MRDVRNPRPDGRLHNGAGRMNDDDLDDRWHEEWVLNHELDTDDENDQ